MESNLKNSIYLREPNKEETLAKTEEIMREDGSAQVNQSARKRSIKYHPFEKTMMSNYQQPATQWATTIEPDDHLQPPTEEKPTHRIPRLCHNPFNNLFNEQIPPKPKVDPKAIEHRDLLSKQHQQRKVGKIEVFKANLLRRIHFEGSDEIESSIQEEIVESLEAKQAKVYNFIKRQQFFAQEKEILREMREFCQYGSIRIGR